MQPEPEPLTATLVTDGTQMYPANIVAQFALSQGVLSLDMDTLHEQLRVEARDANGKQVDLQPTVYEADGIARIGLVPTSTVSVGTYNVILTLRSGRGLVSTLTNTLGLSDDTTLFSGTVNIAARAWNADRDRYVAGETAVISLGLSDTQPCNTQILDVTLPDGTTDSRLLESAKLGACKDKAAAVALPVTGTYQLTMRDDTNTESRNLVVDTTSATVRLQRASVSRAEPTSAPRMSITVLPSLTFIGTVTDRMPYKPEPEDMTATVGRSGEMYTVSWEKRFEAGVPVTLSYTMTLPKDAESHIVLFGPASVTGETERSVEVIEVVTESSSSESSESSSASASASQSSASSESSESSVTSESSASSESYLSSQSSESSASSESFDASSSSASPEPESASLLQSFLVLPSYLVRAFSEGSALASADISITEERQWQMLVMQRSETSAPEVIATSTVELTPTKTLFEANEAATFRLLATEFETADTLTENGQLKNDVALTKIAEATLSDADISAVVLGALVEKHAEKIAYELSEDSVTFNTLKQATDGRRSAVQLSAANAIEDQADVQERIAAIIADEPEIQALTEQALTADVRTAVVESLVSEAKSEQLADVLDAMLVSAELEEDAETILVNAVKDSKTATTVIADGMAQAEAKTATESDAPTLSVTLTDANGRTFTPKYHFKKGSVILALEPERSFTPGLYTLDIIIRNPVTGAEQRFAQDFAWGVLAMNPNKDVFVAGEKARLDIGVLDDHGEIVCEADLTLQITAPSGAVTTLTTDDASITVTGTCSKKEAGFIEPDFTTLFSLDEAGMYHLNLTAVTPNGEREISSDVLVVQSPTLHSSPAIISRTSATRLWPFAPAPMTIDVTFNENFTGTIRDIVPEGFEITDRGGATISTIVDEQGTGTTLSWKGSWKAGETATFSYVYDAPDISPEFYLVGPLRLTSSAAEISAEYRHWQIANDGDGTVNTRTWDNGGGDGLWSTAANWTSDTVPDSDDIAYFGATSTANSTVNASFAGMVGALKVAPGYTGTITLNRHLTLSGGSLTLSGGTLDFSNAGRTLTVSHDFVTYPKAILNAGTGTIVLTGTGASRVLTTTGALNNLTMNASEGLVGHWKFDDGTGSSIAVDATANGNDGTLTNGPTWSTSVPTTSFANPKSLHFDDSNDYVLLPASAAFDLQRITISAWVKASNFDQYGTVFEKTTDGTSNTQYNFHFNQNNHELFFQTYHSGGGMDNTGVSMQQGYLTNNAWNHIAATYDGTNKIIYLNGTLRATKAVSATLNTNPAGLSVIGANGSRNSAFFLEGYLDDLRIYNRALPQGEITRLATGYGTSGSGTYTLGSNLDINGNLNILTSGITAGSYGITVAGNWSNTGNFNKGSGTVTFDGAGNQTISGSNVFNIMSASASTSRTLFLDYNGRQSVSGSLILRGAAGQVLKIRSTNAGSTAAILLDGDAGTQTIDYVDAKDSYASGGASILCNTTTEGCVNSGNNTNWDFTSTTRTITGKVYSDEGTTPISGVNVAISFNGGTSLGIGTTDAGGQYSFTTAANMTGGTILTLYLDGASQKAVTVTLGSGSSMTGMHLYQNRLIVRSDSGSVALTNAHLNIANNNGDSDITAIYNVDTSNILQVAANKELYVWTGDTYTPGARVKTHDIEVKGTLTLGTNGLTVTGSLVTNAGTMTTSTGVTLGSTGSEILSTGTNTLQNLVLKNQYAPVGHWKFDEGVGTIAKDSSGNGNNATLNNGPAWRTGTTSTRFYNPRSLSFDGSNDYLSIPGSAVFDLQRFSISAWVYSTNFQQKGFIFEKTTNGSVNTQYSFFFENPGYPSLVLRTYGGTDLWPNLTGLITNSTWNLVTATYDGTYKKIYVNSTLRGTLASAVTLPTNAAGTSFIGAYGGGGSYHLTGLIDDVRVYDRALASSEVARLASGYNDTGSGGTYTLGSALDVDGNLTIVNNMTLAGGSSAITVAGNWDNRGGFTGDTGSVAFDGTGNQTVSGSTLYYAMSATTNAARTMFFDYTSRQSASGSLTLRGVSGNKLSIRSTRTGSGARVDLESDVTQLTTDFAYADVKDANAGSGATLTCIISTEGCTNSGNNTNWNFYEVITVAGTVYTDEGTTGIGAGRNVALSLNGAAAIKQGTTVAGGYYVVSFTGATLTGGTIMSMYLDGASEKAVTVTLGSGSSMTGMHLYQNHLIVRSDSGSVALTNAHLNIANNNADSDMSAIYNVDTNGVLQIAADKELWVWTGDTFTPGARVKSHDVEVKGTLTLGTNGLTVTGSLVASAGTMTTSTGVILASTTTETFTPGTTEFQNLTVTSGTYTLGSALDVNGNLNITGGGISAGSYAITVAGNWNNAGTFTKGTSSVSFDGTGNQTISGTTVFHALSATTSAARTIFFDHTGRQSASGSLTLRGVSGNKLSIRSTSAGTKARIDLDTDATEQLSTDFAYLDVQDSNATGGATLVCSIRNEGCTNSDNNSGWDFGPYNTIVGTAYSDEGTTGMSAGTRISVSLNGGAAVGSGNTVSGGGYRATLTGSFLTGGTIISVYIDGASEKAVTVTLGSGSNMSGVDLYQNHLIVRSDSGSVALTNAHLNIANNNADSDMSAIYNVDTNGVLQVAADKELWVWTGDTFTPGGKVKTHDVEVKGTLTLGTSSLTVTGSLIANAGTMTTSTGITLGASGAESLTMGSNSVTNLTVTSGTYTLGSALDVNGNLNITGGGISAGSYAITVAGNWNNAGTFTKGSGTVTFDGTGNQTMSGTTVFNNLTATASSARTLFLAHSGRQSVSGALILQGASAGARLSIRSTSAGTAAAIMLDGDSGTQTIEYLSVKDSNAAGGATLVCEMVAEGCSDQGSNTNWFFIQTINGRAFSNAGLTSLAGKTVAVSRNGAAAFDTAVTDANGVFALSGATMTGGSILTLYLDNETQDAVTVTLGSGASMSGINLYQDHLIVRNAGSGTLTSHHLNIANNNGDSDISSIYSTSTNVVTTVNGKKLFVWTGATLSLGGALNIGTSGTASELHLDGSLTQGDNALTVYGNYTQSGGTFTGSSGGSAMTVENFILSGGTFTSTTGTLTVGNGSNGAFTHTAGGTFNHNNGTVKYGGSQTTWNVATSETFYNLEVDLWLSANATDGYTLTIASGDTLIVTNTFTHTDGQINTGTIEAQGNVVIGSSANGGNATLSFLVAGDQTITGNDGSTITLNINKSSGTVSAGSTNLAIAGFTLSSGTFTSTTGTLTIGSNGNGAFTHTAGGTFNHNNGTVKYGGSQTTWNVATSETFYNLEIDTWLSTNTSGGYPLTIASGDILIVTNTFTHTDGEINSGTIEARGNVVVGSSADGGTVALTFSGTADQTYTDNGGTKTSGRVTIAKTSGTVTLASAMSYNTSGQDLSLTGGTLDLNGYNLTVNDQFVVGTGTTLRLQGNETITGGPDTVYQRTTAYYDAPSGTISMINKPFWSVVLGSTGSAIFRLPNQTATTLSGSLTMSGGTLGVSNGQTLTVSGAWLGTGGTFSAGTGTVVLKGQNSSISLIETDSFNNLTMSGGTHTLGSALDVNGNFRMSAGGLSAGSNAITVAGNWYNTGTFTKGTSSVTLDGTGNQTVSGTTVFNNLTAAASSARTIFFDRTGRQSVSGSLILQGASAGARLSVRSTLAGSAAPLVYDGDSSQASADIAYVDVKDSNASAGQLLLCVTATEGCIDSGNNSNWAFIPLSNVTGKVYSDEGTTPLTGVTVAASINGAAAFTTDAVDAGGQYTVTNMLLTGGSILSLYIDGNSADAVTVTLASGSTMTGIHLYQNHLIVRSDSGSVSLTSANLNIANNNGDSDMTAIYNVDSNNILQVAADKELWVWTGDTFTPGARVKSHDVEVKGTLTLGTNGLTVTGSLVANAGTMTTSTGVTLASSTSETLSAGSNSLSNLTITSGTYTLGANLDVNGNLRITGGGISAGSYTITVAGNWNNAGTFTKGTSTVTFDGSGNQTMSGTTVFHNLTATTATARTLFMDYSGRQSASGALTLRGAASNLLSLRSTRSGSAASLLLDGSSGTQTIDYLDVKDSNAAGGTALICTAGCLNSLNNTNWAFPWSGTVYSDEGVTSMGAGKTVAVSVNGGAPVTADTDASGIFIINNPAVSGDTVAIYLDGETEKAALVTVTDNLNVSGMNLYQNRLIVRHENGSEITNSALTTAATVADTDLTNFFSTSNGNLTMTLGNELLVWTGATFHPGGTLAADDLDIRGRLRMGGKSLNVSGSAVKASLTGAVLVSTGTTTFDSASLETIALSGATLATVRFTGGGLYEMSGALKMSTALTISAGTLSVRGYKLDTTGAVYRNDGTLKLAGNDTLTGFTNDTTSGTTLMSSTTSRTGFSGLTSFKNLSLSGSATWTLNSAITTNGTLSITGSTLDVSASNYAVTVRGAWNAGAGTFTKRAGTVTLVGSGALTARNPFNTLAVIGGGTYSLGRNLGVSGALLVQRGLVTMSGKNMTASGMTLGGGSLSGGTGALTVTYNVTMTGGTLTAPTTTSVGGNWLKHSSATFTAGSGTVTLNGTNQTLSGSSTFYNLTKSGGSGYTLTFARGTTQTVAGVWTAIGQNGGNLRLVSSQSGGQWYINPQSTRTLQYVTVSDSNNSNASMILCDNECTNSGRNTNWAFPWSGTVYTDEGVTSMGAGKTVAMSVNGGTPITDDTNASGVFSITNATSSGDTVAFYLDGETEKAALITVTDGVTMSPMNLYQNRLIVRQEAGSEVQTSHFVTAATVADTDLTNFFSTSNGNLTMTLGNELFVWTGATFHPGGTLAADDLDIRGRLRMGGKSLNVSGSAVKASLTGAVLVSTGTTTFDSASTETVALSGATLATVRFTGGGLYEMSGALKMSTALTISAGTLSVRGYKLDTTGATYRNDGTLKLAGNDTLTGFTNDTTSGTTLMSSNTNRTGFNGLTNFKNLSLSGSATWTLNSAITTNGNLSITGSTLDVSASNYAVTVRGAWNAGAGTFTKRAGTVTLMGSGALTARNPFHTLAVIGGGTYSLGRNLGVSGALLVQRGLVTMSGKNMTASGMTLGGGSVRGGTGTLTVTYNMTMTGGTLTAPSTTRVGGNWLKQSAATFTASGGTVTLNGTNQTLSGSTTFYHLTKSGGSGYTLTFARGTTQTVAGTWTAIGQNGGNLRLVSSQSGGQWYINPQSTRTLQYVSPSDSNNTNASVILCSNDCANSGNNTNWAFPITVTVYTNSGTTLAGADVTVAIAINGSGATKVTAETNAQGVATFTTTSAESGDIVTAWIDGESIDGVTIAKTNGTSLGFIIYANTLQVSHETGTKITSSDVGTGTLVSDTDISSIVTYEYSAGSGHYLYLADNTTFRIKSSSTFEAKGNASVYDADINGTFTMGTWDITVRGSWDATDGTFTGTNNVTFDTDEEGQIITSDGNSFYDITFKVPQEGDLGDWIITDALSVTNSQTITVESDTNTSQGPLIRNVSVTATTSTANITWDTSRTATSRLRYGTSTGSLSTVVTDNNLVVDHEVDLSSLTLNTTYYFQIIATNSDSETTTGAILAFNTLGSSITQEELDAANADSDDSETTTVVSGGGGGSRNPCRNSPLLKMTDVTATPNDDDTVTVTWLTNANAVGAVAYGVVSVDEQGVLDTSSFVQEHSITIKKLKNGEYNYRAESIDTCGNIVRSDVKTFDVTASTLGDSLMDLHGAATPEEATELLEKLTERYIELSKNLSLDVGIESMKESLELQHASLLELSKLVPGPILSGQPKVETTPTTATISWMTNDESNSFVSYAPQSLYTDGQYVQTSGNPDEQTLEHIVTLTGLTPGTLYHYSVKSQTSFGTETSSQDFTFRTTQTGIEIQSYSVDVLNTESAAFRWKTNADTTTVLTYTPYINGKADTERASVQKVTALSTTHQITVKDFEPGTVYQVELAGSDSAGNTVSKIIPRFSTVSENLAPIITQVQTDAAISPGKDSKIQAVISWNTNEHATGQVFYGQGVVTGSGDLLTESTPLDGTFNKKHVVLLPSLAPGTIYSFQVESKDATGLVTRSQTFTILTPRQEESVFQVILMQMEDTFGWMRHLRGQ